MNVLMKCGCRAQGVDAATGRPVCVVHIGIKPGADEVADPPELDRRFAQCGYCQRRRCSSLALPFFEYHPEREQDSFYCGCRGWD